jgi:hypothetical protein
MAGDPRFDRSTSAHVSRGLVGRVSAPRVGTAPVSLARAMASGGARHQPLGPVGAGFPTGRAGPGFSARTPPRPVARDGRRPAGTSSPESRPAPLFPTSSVQRFSETLRQLPAEPAQPLPHYFQPLARAIAGSRSVVMRTGPATQAALAAAGKAAATVGGVIHLRRAPDRSPGSAHIMAHELVHAARPSSAPRFFGDERHSAEEALAERTGGLARALVAPQVATPPAQRAHDRLAWGTQGMVVSAMGGALKTLNHESPAAPAPPPPPVVQRKVQGGTLVERTADMFRRPSGSSAPSGGGSRLPAVTDTQLPRPGDPPIVRRSQYPTVQRALDTGMASPSGDTEATMVGGLNAATFEALLEALEQRILDELDRRGLRHHPGVF